MLYGIRRDLQEEQVDAGWRVRTYVPYGSEWYPYFMRRLAERPANVSFLSGTCGASAAALIPREIEEPPDGPPAARPRISEGAAYQRFAPPSITKAKAASVPSSMMARWARYLAVVMTVSFG